MEFKLDYYVWIKMKLYGIMKRNEQAFGYSSCNMIFFSIVSAFVFFFSSLDIFAQNVERMTTRFGISNVGSILYSLSCSYVAKFE